MLTGVIGLFLTGLNEEVVVTRALDVEEAPVAPPRCAFPPNDALLVFLAVVGCFLTDSSCRSLANLKLSLVLPERLYDGVCNGIAFAVGGVLIPVNSLAVPKLMLSECAVDCDEFCE